MTAGPVSPASPANPIRRVRAALARTDDGRTDGQLLAAFRDARDTPDGQDAFAALVYRHGPRVLGVCRRITGHDHDADDACQAVFLVLARRAADVRPPDAVGAWLHGVAFRTAQDARVMAARRRAKVAPAADLPDVPTEPGTPDLELAAALDAEIAKLPDAHRAAVVLCELDGLPRKDAAARLGVAEGTLSSRLADARKRLAAGLKRKGFALPAALATALPACGSETVFPLACRLGQSAAAGDQLPAGVPVALADVVTKAMYLKRLFAPILAGVFAVATCLLLAGWLTFRAVADEPRPAPQPKAEPPKPAPAKPGRLVVWTQAGLKLLDPDGKNEELFLDRNNKNPEHAVLSPDGKAVAYLMHLPAPPDKPREGPPRDNVYVRKLGEEDATEFKVFGRMIAWSPDGKELLVSDFEDRPRSGPKDGLPKTTVTALDVATKKETALPVPAGHLALGYTPDGKKLLTMRFDMSTGKPVMETCLVSRDGKDVATISDPAYLTMMARLSPDGKTLLFRGMKAPDKAPERPLDTGTRLYVQPVGGKATELPDVPLNAEVAGYCWSPDGKKIAYAWRTMHAEKPEPGKPDERETESHLCVCDADGTNHKTILTEKGRGQYHVTLGSVDWR